MSICQKKSSKNSIKAENDHWFWKGRQWTKKFYQSPKLMECTCDRICIEGSGPSRPMPASKVCLLRIRTLHFDPGRPETIFQRNPCKTVFSTYVPDSDLSILIGEWRKLAVKEFRNEFGNSKPEGSNQMTRRGLYWPKTSVTQRLR